MKLTRGMAELRHARRTTTFDGTSGGGQAAANVTMFTITGRVLIVHLSLFCTSSLTESGATATISAGGASDVDLIRATANAVNIDINEFWDPAGAISTGISRMGTNTSADGELLLMSEDPIYAPAVTDVDGGSILADVWYLPVTDNGALA